MAAASAAPLAAVNGAVKMTTTSQAYLDGGKVRETRALISELCRQFYHLGWVSGTGGSITIKVHDDSIPKPHQLIVMSPSGVQKERMMEEDMYVLAPDGSVLSEPSAKPWPNKPPKCSDCGPLFMKAYEMRNAGAVIHSHGMESCLVTMINPLSKEFRITHMEMIKGIQGHGYYDELVVPIIENTAHERELTQSLAEAIQAYPKTTAVLVRNHGVYIWGDSWINAKTQAECYHYLFDAAIKLHQLGFDWSTPSHGPIQTQNSVLSNRRNQKVSTKAGALDNAIEPKRSCIVLDIEGTTTPISFVTDVLFPYARDSVGKHLELTYDSAETQEDIKLLRAQVQEDLANNLVGAVPIPEDGNKVDIIAAVVANVEAMIKADRKITSLKQLQARNMIYLTGFQSKEIEAIVFDDVPEALEKWHDLGIKVYIYSSGSRLAQRLLFGNTNYGDLRKYLCGYFDTTVGNKREVKSYTEISESLGVDHPSEILFVTDVYQEATAAKAAGLDVIISIRPGNGPLPELHGFQTINSFSEI
ncbi:Probable bifunctional methylthioribulose-1-phosphate dehydratase/enolase-phosphatase E1 [Striga hermonthica]|uniref:Probable bifunctional methylthioribulose-1-phosphate dehydratase/enolase-phosphatase E1 n=1 Tax=Striga hermonthica TaxID=68872 RepID=A0A9N7MVA2_STRHE|nr:Probable bifunctional methylthioribulose-1-phosphate dehydratase/enolase-phosphatase E1 [Striga hermonthica]